MLCHVQPHFRCSNNHQLMRLPLQRCKVSVSECSEMFTSLVLSLLSQFWSCVCVFRNVSVFVVKMMMYIRNVNFQIKLCIQKKFSFEEFTELNSEYKNELWGRHFLHHLLGGRGGIHNRDNCVSARSRDEDWRSEILLHFIIFMLGLFKYYVISDYLFKPCQIYVCRTIKRF